MKLFNALAILLALATLPVSAEDKSQAPDAEVDATLVAEAVPEGFVILTAENTITMDEVFTWQTTSSVTQKARALDASLPSGDAIYLVIDSGGGMIDAGVELIENLRNLNRPVHTISLFSASMGFQTVQGLNNRYITENGTLMSHKARGGFSGEFPGQLDSRYNHYLRRVQRLDAKVVARTNGKHDAKSYASLIENEYWCDGEDCVKQGFADAVIRPSCDKSLDGTRNVLYDRFMYMNIVIEIVLVKARCPTVTGMIDYNIYIDGKPVFTEGGADALKERASKAPVVNASPEMAYYLARLERESTGNPAFQGLTVETIENIKRTVNQKLQESQVRKIQPY